MQPTQKEICDHLSTISQSIDLTEFLKNKLGPTGFLIGAEATPHSTSSRYFSIIYNEIRTDVHFVQITPEVVPKRGYLQIDEQGNIALRDDKFEAYHSSCVFEFRENTLQMHTNWNIADRERRSSACVKATVALTFAFTLIATIAGAANGNIKYKPS